jgi:hypothetical protein
VVVGQQDPDHRHRTGTVTAMVVPRPGALSTASRAAQGLDPLAHAPQPEPAVGAVAVGGGGEPGPVVAHVQGGLAVHVGQGDRHPAGVGVPGHVGQGLLGDPEQGDLGVGAERPGRPGDGGGGVQARLLGHPAGQPAQGLAQRRRRQRLRPQVPDQPAGLGQVLPGRPPGPLQVAAGLGGVGGQVGLGRLELEDDADEALGEGVVDVAGQPLALGQAAGVVLGRGQLAAGGLQLLDQLAALVALLDDAGDPEREQGAEHHRQQPADDRALTLRERLAGGQHLAPDDQDAEGDRGRDGPAQPQMPEDLRVQGEQEREVGGVDPGEHEPERQQPGQVAEDQRRPLLVIPQPPEEEVPGRHRRRQPGRRPPAGAGAGRVEQDQDRGQAEHAVEERVPDPLVLVPGVDPALAGQPPAPLVDALSALSWNGTRSDRRWGAPGRWIGTQ